MFALEIKTWYTARDISTEFPSNQEYTSLILPVKFDIDSVSQNTITHLLFAHKNVFIALTLKAPPIFATDDNCKFCRFFQK